MKRSKKSRTLSPAESAQILTTLEERFAQNPARHRGLAWAEVKARLERSPDRLWSLAEMERTGGEPDVVGRDEAGAFLFVDCAPETPKDRRSVCYDREGLQSRKEHAPANTAMDLAAEIGIEVLDEEQYRALQRLGEFDLKTSSWLRTPTELRKLGGALFGDRRYGRVFIYHNGAQSYYSSRAFRGLLKV